MSQRKQLFVLQRGVFVHEDWRGIAKFHQLQKEVVELVRKEALGLCKHANECDLLELM